MYSVDFCEHDNIFDVDGEMSSRLQNLLPAQHRFTVWTSEGGVEPFGMVRQTHTLDIFKQNVPYIMKEIWD